jgi:LacI family gluconate utilization system Gnt-I transcriptional repressor
VLNHPEQVAEGTRERINEAIRVTGYTPNLLAAGVRSSRSKLVAAIVPTVSGPMFLETIQALTETLDRNGYQLILGQAGYDGLREDELLSAIIGRRPAGIALIGVVHSAESRRRLLASQIPVVETWDLTPTPIDMVVGFSHEETGAAVCDFLLRKGRKRPRDRHGSRRAREAQGSRIRRRGAEAGDRGADRMDRRAGTLAGGREAAARLLARDTRPDAIFCSSDLIALGVVTEATAHGVSVPYELAVVGFGDLNFSEGVTPPLTTVHLDGSRIGELTGSMLVDRAEGRQPGQKRVDVTFSILERGST